MQVESGQWDVAKIDMQQPIEMVIRMEGEQLAAKGRAHEKSRPLEGDFAVSVSKIKHS